MITKKVHEYYGTVFYIDSGDSKTGSVRDSFNLK